MWKWPESLFLVLGAGDEIGKDSAEIVQSLLSMHKLLLGDSFKPTPSLDRTSGCHIDFRTEGSVLTFALSKI